MAGRGFRRALRVLCSPRLAGPLKRFVIYGWFEAEDIDDALSRLATHFYVQAEGDASSELGESVMEIRPGAPDEVVMLRLPA